MKTRGPSAMVVRACFIPALLYATFVAAGQRTADDGLTQYDYPGRIAGGITFDDDGGLWVADGIRSNSTTKLYYLKGRKLVRTIDVPVKWIGALTYGAGSLWATTGQIVQIDPATGEVLKTIKVQAPNEHTGLAFDGKVLLYCLRAKTVVVRTGVREVSRRSGTGLPRHLKAGGLAFDGKDMWVLSHRYGLISRLGRQGITAERGLVLPPGKREHRIGDIAWDGKAFWLSLTKRLGIDKHDNAIVRVGTVDHRLDSEIPHGRVRINYPCEGSLVLQRTAGSQRPQRYKSLLPRPGTEPSEPETPEPRLETGEYSIPEGEYRVLEYACFKTDDAHFKWRVKVLDRGTLTVRADGKVQDVQLGTGLAGKLTIKPPTSRWQQGRYSLHFAIVDSTGGKVQFRRVLKTPDASFVMKDKSGKKVASGHFAAGVDAYLGYHVRIPRQVEFPLSVKLTLDSGPFDIKLEDVEITELPKEGPQGENTQ